MAKPTPLVALVFSGIANFIYMRFFYYEEIGTIVFFYASILNIYPAIVGGFKICSPPDGSSFVFRQPKPYQIEGYFFKMCEQSYTFFGKAIGSFQGESLYHASLSPGEFGARRASYGLWC